MSTSDNGRDPRLGRFEFGIIHRKVRQLIGGSGFTRQDRKPLEQELIAMLLHSLPAFDPTKSHRNVFVTTVVERSVAKILRPKRAEKRDDRCVGSLNVMVNAGGEMRMLASTIGNKEYDARRGVVSRSDEATSELASDIADVICRLPEDLRFLAEQLKEKSLAQIAREIGVPRTTLRERLAELRSRFESADMRFHL